MTVRQTNWLNGLGVVAVWGFLTLAVVESSEAATVSSKNALADTLKTHVKVLASDIGERSVERGSGLDRARAYVIDTLDKAGLDVREQVYTYKGRSANREVASIIATLPGYMELTPPYLVGAHYDTVWGTPGADDNASGVAVLLELAKRAAADPPPVPVTFVAFTLEEPPSFGTDHQSSRVFVKKLKEKGETVAGAIVLEMVGMTKADQEYPVFLKMAGYPDRGDFIGVVGNGNSKGFGEHVVAAMRQNPAMPVETLYVWLNGWLLPDTRLSDHASFWDAGIPALMVTDTAYFRNPNYHNPGDKPGTLDYRFMAELVDSLDRALRRLP